MYVGRTSRFGNPFAVQRVGQRYAVLGMPTTYESQAEANTVAVGLYREWVGTDDPKAARIRRDLHILRALDSLACNCAPELDCHVDVLIEMLSRYATA